jgi:hypothetical protein
MRLLAAWALGDDDRRVPAVPAGLPLVVAPIVADNVRLLTFYQDAEYARLYMSRLGRFVNRRGIDDQALCEIARLLAGRMAYDDLIWHAQQTLARIAEQGIPSLADDVYRDPVRPSLRDLISMFPESVAWPLITVLEWRGRADATVTLTLTGRTLRGRLTAHVVASLRRLRPQSVHYTEERPLVERWLHMIDRALVKQPAATWEVIETATLLRGLGEQYRHALANWHLMINGLAKPTFDGDLPLPDLGEKLAQVRAIAGTDPSGERVRLEIAKIRAGLPHAA